MGVHAKVEFKNKTVQKFVNENCEESDTCSLKSFTLKSNDYITTLGADRYYGSQAHAFFETDKVSNLTDYGVVQFIKGCAFRSKKSEDGTVKKWRGIVREFFGNMQVFHHPEWVIDSVDADAMYNNYTSEDRHGAHRWNSKKYSTAKETEHYFLNKRPTNPVLYVRDMPSMGSYDDVLGASNVSLQFKTCLYKTSDIPESTTPDDLRFAQPISCLEWSSSFVFNHDSKHFESPKDIDPFCL